MHEILDFTQKRQNYEKSKRGATDHEINMQLGDGTACDCGWPKSGLYVVAKKK